MHDLPLIATIAAAFTAAWLLGLLTQWLKLSPIVGYLLAGVLIGPHTPGFVGDAAIAHQLAEVGVILLMFGVGLHFHLKDLLAVKGVAIPGAVGQSLVATLTSIVVFGACGLPVHTGAVLGMALAVASTVVLMRVLMDADALSSPQGHVAVGWLIVEDIFTVIVLVVIPVLGVQFGAAADLAHASEGESPSLWLTLGLALLKLGVFIGIVMVGGSRVVPWLLVRVAKLRSRELFTLTVLVFSIAIAAGSYFFFGASMALGAFLAGMVVAQSSVSHQVAADALPMRDAFAVLFFVSVGMLYDPAYLFQQPLLVLAGLSVVLVAKPLAALAIVAILGHSARTALTVAIGLAQIGEFSFILSELARKHALLSDAEHNVLVTCSILSITLNPLLFRMLPGIEAWLRQRPRLWQILNSRAEQRAAIVNAKAASHVALPANQARPLAIVVGYGQVGRAVERLLRDAQRDTVVIDVDMDKVGALTQSGHTAMFGDASNRGILEHAGVRRAEHMVVTLPNSADRAAVVTAARNLNPRLRILVRARYLREREDLERAGATAAVFEEAESAVALARLVLAGSGVQGEVADRKIQDLRLQLITENLVNIRSQRVGSVMVPWLRVGWLSAGAERSAVLAQISQERYSRWPVVDERTGRATGYLLTKDLVENAARTEWTTLVRPLTAIRPDESIESILTRMQGESASAYLVEDRGRPVGWITLEDILEQVVGQIEDEYPHEAPVSLPEALSRGGIVLDLAAKSRDQTIVELVQAIPRRRLPTGVDREQLAALALKREEELPTDLGNGVAIPHARCPGLESALVVFGRSTDGVVFSASSSEVVHLVFLLVTPLERPEAQLALLSQLAKIAGTVEGREALLHASFPGNVADVLQGRSGNTPREP